jgi:nuclear pore complex protein Nup188
LPETIFARLAQSRADLAFALLQRIINVSRHNRDARDILKVAWETLRRHAPDFGLALTSPSAVYDRTLLKILYLALQIHSRDTPVSGSEPSVIQDETKASEVMKIVLEILSVVVAQGFRSLTSALHEDISQVTPGDFVLINGILRTCFHIPGIERHIEQLMTILADDSTARYASTLLSWSDRLTVGKDPIFGDISMTFLLELSSVPALAESIAASGILVQISGANLVNYLRRPGGIGPFDEPSRMYKIWTRGILPFVINLLGAIGPPIAGEVGAFLNQFKGQLARATSNFDLKPSPSAQDPNSGYLTLSMASEAQSLALVCTILDMFREAGASAGIVASDVPELAWDRLQVKGDIERWISRRNALRENILPTNAREEGWSRQKASSGTSGAVTRLEEKVVDELVATLAMFGDGDV